MDQNELRNDAMKMFAYWANSNNLLSLASGGLSWEWALGRCLSIAVAIEFPEYVASSEVMCLEEDGVLRIDVYLTQMKSPQFWKRIAFKKKIAPTIGRTMRKMIVSSGASLPLHIKDYYVLVHYGPRP